MTKTNKKIKSIKGPTGRNLQIEPEKSDSMLESENNNIQIGKIVAVGPQAKKSIGDTIIFNAWGLNIIPFGESKYYYILDIDDFVLAVI